MLAGKVSHGWNQGFWQVVAQDVALAERTWEGYCNVRKTKQMMRLMELFMITRTELNQKSRFTEFCFAWLKNTQAQLRSIHAVKHVIYSRKCSSDSISVRSFVTVSVYELQQVSGELHRAALANSRLVLSHRARCCQHCKCWVYFLTLKSSRHP